jgi:hypothetical protein
MRSRSLTTAPASISAVAPRTAARTYAFGLSMMNTSGPGRVACLIDLAGGATRALIDTTFDTTFMVEAVAS